MQQSSLEKCPLFHGLSKADFEAALLFFCAKKEAYKKGTILSLLSDPSPSFALVLSGTVHVCYEEADGNRVIYAAVTDGQTFGESLRYLMLEPNVYPIAETDIELLLLSTENLHIFPKTPLEFELQSRFTSMIAKKALEMNGRIQILSKHKMRDKIYATFSLFGGKADAKPFSLPFDRYGMAFYLGVDRSALSRELSLLKKDGVLSYRKNQFIWYKAEPK